MNSQPVVLRNILAPATKLSPIDQPVRANNVTLREQSRVFTIQYSMAFFPRTWSWHRNDAPSILFPVSFGQNAADLLGMPPQIKTKLYEASFNLDGDGNGSVWRI